MSTVPEHYNPEGVTLTDNAARRVAELAKLEEQTGAMLRISVEGGGCSGFHYDFIFPVYEINDDDMVVTHQDSTLLVDDISLNYMKGSVVDYIESLAGSMFDIKNPNTTANCGCGNSFAV